ncbi:signal transduction histidine kinase [Rhizomicrobium palustre]|uniref:histidine kinase n=1 Tax=Rhizomicrobium palustre TaxID=189966 RepID=A0A846MZ39_9PROT|nr:ATP-binding protein [Rhizomicrobium palustre]NIK88495.1 signal transduction histidine kinase [Rhizomicrobium palustre]
MNIYWQITILETLENVAVFAVAVVAFGQVYRNASRLFPKHSWAGSAAVGVLFGLSTSLSLLLPIHVGGGALTGTDSALLGLVGFLVSPLAALIAFTLSLAAEFVSAQSAERLDLVSIAISLFATLAGLAGRFALSLAGHKRRASYLHLPAFGVLLGLSATAATGLVYGEAAARDCASASILAGIMAATALGTLLIHETRRDRAERELRESEARLALQTRELAAARDAAERANEAKSAFLANMSHELRTPLNAIIGFSEIMSGESFGPLGSQRYREYACDIHDSGLHLLSLINDLLDVAKIEAGRMDVQKSRVDVSQALDVVARLMTAKLREKSQSLRTEIAPETPPLYVDERAFKQVMLNILSNAVKFTQLGGEIALLAEPGEEGGVEIRCIDNGRGIPKDRLEAVFSPFNQIDARFDRVEGGTGLGLSLVRGLVKLNGGKVWLESDAGKGCTVVLVLPAAPPEAATAAA